MTLLRPYRRKPASWLRYPSGSVLATRASGFTCMTMHCLGPAREAPRCWHQADVPLARLPDWLWSEIGPYMRCTQCEAVGYVDMRVNWGELIDFNRPTGHLIRPR